MIEKIEEEIEKYTTDSTILNNFKVMIDKFRIYKQTLTNLSEHLAMILTTLNIKKYDLQKHKDKKNNKIKIIKNAKNKDNPFTQLKTELIDKLESGHIITASDVKYFREKLDSITKDSLTGPLKKINTTIFNEIREPILDDIRRIFKFGILSTNGTAASITTLNNSFWKKHEELLKPTPLTKKSRFKFI